MKDIILEHTKARQTIKRLAYEIYEKCYQESEIYLLGINTKGMKLGNLLKHHLLEISPISVNLHHLKINPKNPLQEVVVDIVPEALTGKLVIIVDDVANTGRTLFYGCRPIMDSLPKAIEFAVLVDRKHKNFPVKVDYVGLTLATTLKEHIIVDFDNDHTEVYFA